MIELEKERSENPSIEELEEAHRAVMVERASLARLSEHPGWKVLLRIIEMNAEAVRKDVEMKQFVSDADVFQDQYKKGVVHGLLRAPTFIEGSLQAYDMELDTLTQALQEMQNAGRNTSDPDDAGASANGEPEPEFAFGGGNGHDSSADKHAP